MARNDLTGKGVEFGKGQPTNLGGRPKKNSVLIELESIAESEGKMILQPSNFKLLPDGTCQIQLPTYNMVAMKLLQLVMKGDVRAMDMFFKLTGEYKAVKHDVEINDNPFRGKDLDKLSEKDKQILLSLGEKL
jgi:hypothetical protein